MKKRHQFFQKSGKRVAITRAAAPAKKEKKEKLKKENNKEKRITGQTGDSKFKRCVYENMFSGTGSICSFFLELITFSLALMKSIF
ncbi:hypothetical protein MsAg5_08170 [Methanosarcinaceae archaeon Ag5]|uniref:Uncharacterized protein n=1 Tax=Methanolapillus africanus TaxID=3028297 RepID=A0AAE4SDN6_9EURY|nr:hypothetical protein [Methanosarcinaceae archaeon Ag5]